MTPTRAEGTRARGFFRLCAHAMTPTRAEGTQPQIIPFTAKGRFMNSRNADAILDLLTETAQRYVDHQEDDLGRPVLQSEYFEGIARHFINTLVAFAVNEREPTEVIKTVLKATRILALKRLKDMREKPSEDDDLP